MKRRLRKDYSRKDYRNPLFKRRTDGKKRAAWRRWTYPVIGLLAVIGWIWFLAFSGTFRVTDVKIVGNDKIPEWELRDAVDELMQTRRWFVIPKRTMFFLTEQDIDTHLKEAFVLESVDVLKEPPHGITITVQERVSSIFLQLSDGSQAMLDLEGIVVRTYAPEEALDIVKRFGPERNAQPDPLEGLHVLHSDSDETVDLRDKAVDPSIVSAVIAVPKLVEEQFSGSMEAREVRVESLDTSTLRIVTSEGWAIYIDVDESLPTQISDAATVVRDKVRGDRVRLDYVDVRFGEKVFFKLR